MSVVWQVIRNSRKELWIVLSTLLILVSLPIVCLVIFTASGISLVSEALASINPITHLVEIKDADGRVIRTLEATTVWPVCGVITLEFGMPDPPYQVSHTGIDIANDLHQVGSPVTTFMEGTVIRVTDSNTGFGKHVVVDHGDGLSSLYAHLSSLDVVPGQQVQPGSIIGLEGSTGASTGPHVHFTIMVASIPVNPRIFMVGQPLSCR